MTADPPLELAESPPPLLRPEKLVLGPDRGGLKAEHASKLLQELVAVPGHVREVILDDARVTHQEVTWQNQIARVRAGAESARACAARIPHGHSK